MTPERIAAGRIARVIAGARGTPEDLGRLAVEHLSVAGLVIVTAARAQQLLAVEQAARALARSEEHMLAALHGDDPDQLGDPWPEADALVAALKESGAEKRHD